ncbi:MAG: protein kinase [Candidatus Hydrogenedens sp.]|nr:protein kinase [Candidatus Hydrogenedens sp.]
MSNEPHSELPTVEATLRQAGCSFDDSDRLWLRVNREALPPSGWKLHVTTVPTRLHLTLQRIVPRLATAAAFKVIRTAALLEDLNDGRYGIGQIGKALTIYARSESEAAAIGADLTKALHDLPGPPVVTDAGYFGDAGPVFYRYGPFEGAYRVNELGRKIRRVHLPTGDVIDDTPGVHVLTPSQLPQQPEIDSLAFLRQRFLFVQLLHLSAKGAVMAAIEQHDPKRGVRIIKTARKEAQSDLHGRDAAWALKREHALLRNLHDHPVLGADAEWCVAPDGSACALIRPYLEGEPLAHHWQQADSRSAPSRQRLVDTMHRLADAVRELHQGGYVARDISPANVLVGDECIHLLDLELAHPLAESGAPYRRGTRGFYDSRKPRDAPATEADDYYALIALAVMAHTGVYPEWIKPEQVLENSPLPAASPLFSEAHSAAVAIQTNPDAFWKRFAALIQTIDTPIDAASPTARRVKAQTFADYLNQWLVDTPHAWIELDRASVFGGLAGVLLTATECFPEVLAETVFQHDAVLDRLQSAAKELAPIPGYYFGAAGIGLALIQTGTLLKHAGWQEAGRSLLLDPQGLHSDIPDLCHGAAGLVLACCDAASLTGAAAYMDAATAAAERLVALQSEEGAWPWPAGPHPGLSGEKQYGLAHGAAGAIYSLAQLHCRIPDARWQSALQRGVDFLLRGARPLDTDGGEPALWWPVSESDDRCWNAWSHGTPGVVIALASAAALSPAARDALAPAALGITLANNSGYCLCHGIASRLEAYTAALQAGLPPETASTIRAEAARDAAILAALPVQDFEARVNPEAGDDGYGLMKGAAGVWRTLLRWDRLEKVL